MPLKEHRPGGTFQIFGNGELQSAKALLDSATSKCVVKGELILKENGKADGIYLIKKGKVKTVKQLNNGDDQIVKLCTAGDVLGVEAVLSGKKFSTSAFALEDTDILFIPNKLFAEKIRQESSLMLSAFRYINEKTSEIEQRAAMIAGKKVDQRLLYITSLLWKKYGKDKDGFIDVEMSVKDLASLACSSSTSVYRSLQQLFLKKELKYKDGKLKPMNHFSFSCE